VRELPADTVLDGRYRIVSRLGSGGMADVYCAEDNQLGRLVALKVLYERFAEDAEFVERFRREASSAAGLQHQHVVSVYDRGEWEGTSYIAMEFVDGRTLKQVIQADAPLDPVRAIDLAVQVLRATRFAHRRGVIHRDLKPHNVIVDAEDRAKVTDFGIARAGASDMTQTGSIIGTAQYLSPEQAQGHAVTPRSDLYSIGICLYEMVTGRIPFDGESAVTIALKQVNEAPVPPSHFSAAVPAPLEDAVLRALAKDPAERFDDADAFIAALEDARAQIIAGSAPPAQTTAAFTSVASSSIPVVPTAVASARVEERRESVVVAPVRGRSRWPWVLFLGALVIAAVMGALLLAGVFSKKVTVPKVIGTQSSTAAVVLHRAGLEVQIDGVTSTRPRGFVISQTPPFGAKVKEGTTVSISVSQGPGDAQIPVVDGLTRRAARKKLTGRGFEVREHKESSTTVLVGHVTRTQPSGGSTLQIGNMVELYVSSGPPNSVLPVVTGQTVDEARRTLEDAAFRVTTVDRQTSDQAPGIVIAQDPIGGGKVPEGSTITLTVARVPDTVAVPDVVGKLAENATKDLEKAGFTYNQQSVDVTDLAQDGRVQTEKPGAGTQAKPGSPVTITVGHYVTPTTTTPPPTVPTTTP